MLTNGVVEQHVRVLARMSILAQEVDVVLRFGILHQAVISIDQIIGVSRPLYNSLRVGERMREIVHIQIDLHQLLIRKELVFLILPKVKGAVQISNR